MPEADAAQWSSRASWLSRATSLLPAWFRLRFHLVQTSLRRDPFCVLPAALNFFLFPRPWLRLQQYIHEYASRKVRFPGFEIRQMRHIFKINCFATESGKIMIESTSTMAPLGPVIPSDKKEVNVALYNAGAKEIMFGGGIINKNNLPKELQPAVKKSGNLNRSELFSILAVSENADESLKKVNEHSYMI